MKTIKQLKAEIENKKQGVYEKLGTDKCPDEEYRDDECWESWYAGDLLLLNAQLKQSKDILKLIDDVTDKMYGGKIEKGLSKEDKKYAKAHLEGWNDAIDCFIIFIFEELKQKIQGEK